MKVGGECARPRNLGSVSSEAEGRGVAINSAHLVGCLFVNLLQWDRELRYPPHGGVVLHNSAVVPPGNVMIVFKIPYTCPPSPATCLSPLDPIG